MSAPALIDAALELLLSGTGSVEAMNKAAGRAGLGWPPGGLGPAPTVADLLPRDMLERFLEVWLTTGANVLFTAAVSMMAMLEDGGIEGAQLVADSLEADVIERLEGLRVKWEGGAQA